MRTDRDPRWIGGYRLVRRIGQGGQGVVHLAEGPGGTPVAVKLLRDDGDARARARFHKEVATARRVAPFCTARILDAGEDGGAPFVVTEYIDGPSLRDLVERDGPRSGPELYRLAVGTATALAAIHQAGVVHRDFKPGNVLLGPDGPRVIDFGIARSLDLTATATGSIVGTPAYMAPEQFAGRDVGPAADVFAWGATIAYAANGRPPHGQDSIPALMGRLARGESDLGRLDGPLYRLVADCLHRDPSRRPDSRQLLLRLLERDTPIAAEQALAQGRDLAATVVPPDGRTARWTSLRPTDRPVRAANGRWKGPLAVASAAVAVAAVVTAAVVIATTGDSGRTGAGASGPGPSGSTAAPRPTTPAQVVTAVQNAVIARRTVAFTADGNNAQDNYTMKADGRCQIDAELRADCDMTVGDELGGVAQSTVTLVDDTGYQGRLTIDGCPTGALRTKPGNEHFTLACDARRLATPRHAVELLRATKRLQTDGDEATITYKGRVPLTAMAGNQVVGGLYEQFHSARGDAVFTLVTSTDHLPQRLEVIMSGEWANDFAFHAPYTVAYRDWGRAGTVARPF